MTFGDIPDIPFVFISYSWDTKPHMQKIRQFADKLVRNGINCRIDQDIKGTPTEGWPRWCRKMITRAENVVIVWTENYRKRYDMEEEAGKGLGVVHEGNVISQAIYDDPLNSKKFIPTTFGTEDAQHIAEDHRKHTRYNLDDEEDFVRLVDVLQGPSLKPHEKKQTKLAIESPSVLVSSQEDSVSAKAQKVSKPLKYKGMKNETSETVLDSIPFGDRLSRIRLVKSYQKATKTLFGYDQEEIRENGGLDTSLVRAFAYEDIKREIDERFRQFRKEFGFKLRDVDYEPKNDFFTSDGLLETPRFSYTFSIVPKRGADCKEVIFQRTVEISPKNVSLLRERPLNICFEKTFSRLRFEPDDSIFVPGLIDYLEEQSLKDFELDYDLGQNWLDLDSEERTLRVSNDWLEIRVNRPMEPSQLLTEAIAMLDLVEKNCNLSRVTLNKFLLSEVNKSSKKEKDLRNKQE